MVKSTSNFLQRRSFCLLRGKISIEVYKWYILKRNADEESCEQGHGQVCAKGFGVWWRLNHIRTIPRSGSTFSSLCNHLERWAVTQRTSNNPQNWPNWGGVGVVGACSGMGACVEMVSCSG